MIFFFVGHLEFLSSPSRLPIYAGSSINFRLCRTVWYITRFVIPDDRVPHFLGLIATLPLFFFIFYSNSLLEAVDSGPECDDAEVEDWNTISESRYDNCCVLSAWK